MIKPKSRKHEDRIKALEAREAWAEATSRAMAGKLQRMNDRLIILEVQAKATPKSTRKWWKFWA